MILYMLRLGTFGFGGPVALVGYMRRDLVERRGWISENDYREGLALAQMMPGPLAAQLGIYLGYVHYRVVGATLGGIAFVLPSFLMVVALGWAYTHFGGLAWMQAVFYGVGAAVVGIVGRDGGFTAKEATACVIVPTVNPDHVTPHSEAFQAVIWHLFVSHPKLKVNKTKWESAK